ncbi:MAG: ABC transporter permease [Bdellovibrionaceae bacterium]|nr:ABC transporter permease [Pseudobdellovibrionaceae bacterium]
MKYLLRIAFRNVRINLKPSLAALLSISAAYMTILIFDGYIESVSRLYLNSYRHRQMYGDFIIQNPQLRSKEGKADPISYSLTSEQQQRIDSYLKSRSQEVVASVKNLEFVGTISNGRVSTIFVSRAFQQDEGLKLRQQEWGWNALYGKPIHLGEPGNKVLLGQALARTLGCRPKEKQKVLTPSGGFREGFREFNCDTEDILLSVTTATGQVNSLDFKVSGITDAGYRDIDARYVMADFKDAQTLVNTDRVGYYTLLLEDGISQNKFIRDFEEIVTTKDPAIKIQRWQDHAVGDLYNKTMNLLSVFRNFVIIVLVAISGLSIATTFSKNVKERTREIGLLLSLGFYRRSVLNIFLYESMILGLFGVGIGLMAGGAFSIILNASQIYYKAGLLSEPVVFYVIPNWNSLLIGALGLIILAIVACYFATRSTLNKSVVECLQHS